jgi:hypothetical protein
MCYTMLCSVLCAVLCTVLRYQPFSSLFLSPLPYTMHVPNITPTLLPTYALRQFICVITLILVFLYLPETKLREVNDLQRELRERLPVETLRFLFRPFCICCSCFYTRNDNSSLPTSDNAIMIESGAGTDQRSDPGSDAGPGRGPEDRQVMLHSRYRSGSSYSYNNGSNQSPPL